MLSLNIYIEYYIGVIMNKVKYAEKNICTIKSIVKYNIRKFFLINH